MSSDRTFFKNLVEKALTDQGISQAFLARKLGYTPDRFNKWLLGQNQIPFNVVGQIAEFLQISPAEQRDFYRLAGYRLPEWNDGDGASTTCTDESKRTQAVSGNLELYQLQTQRVAEARESICALSWGNESPFLTDAERAAYEDYCEAVVSACLRGVLYRQVITFTRFSNDSLRLAKRCLDLNLINYSLHYLDHSDQHNLTPQLHFNLYDGKTICVAHYRWPHRSPFGNLQLNLNQRDVVNLFQDYFDSVWIAAHPIKDGNRHYPEGEHAFMQQYDRALTPETCECASVSS